MSDQRMIGYQDNGTFQCTEVHHCPFVERLKRSVDWDVVNALAEVDDLKSEIKELKAAVREHFNAKCVWENYPVNTPEDIELWKAFKLGGYGE